jgi:hypothetical protein
VVPATIFPVLLGLIAISGCYVSPIAPHPDKVYVPYPDEADPSLTLAELEEMYTASPDPEPDADVLPPFEIVFDQSYLMLVASEITRKREALARMAYARTDEEQARILRSVEFEHQQFIEFEGFLIGFFLPLLDLYLYQPEGIYLLDDGGRKFMPVSAYNSDPVLPPAEASEFGAAFHAFPHIKFPRGAIGPSTRAISLYIAAPDRRLRFTWIFDPAYQLPDVRDRPGAERKRRFIRKER